MFLIINYVPLGMSALLIAFWLLLLRSKSKYFMCADGMFAENHNNNIYTGAQTGQNNRAMCFKTMCKEDNINIY